MLTRKNHVESTQVDLTKKWARSRTWKEHAMESQEQEVGQILTVPMYQGCTWRLVLLYHQPLYNNRNGCLCHNSNWNWTSFALICLVNTLKGFCKVLCFAEVCALECFTQFPHVNQICSYLQPLRSRCKVKTVSHCMFFSDLNELLSSTFGFKSCVTLLFVFRSYAARAKARRDKVAKAKRLEKEAKEREEDNKIVEKKENEKRRKRLNDANRKVCWSICFRAASATFVEWIYDEKPTYTYS